MVAQATQGVHAQGGRDRAGRLGAQDQLAERDDLDEGTQGFDRLDLLGRKTTFGADDECDMAVDIAALERVGDGKRRAVRPLVRFLPGDDDPVVFRELASDVIESRGVLDDGQDVAAGLLGGGKRDAAPS